MDDQTRRNINKNLDKLVELTHHIDDIIDILHTGGLLNKYMVDVLHKRYPSNKERTKQFYLMLQGRGPEALEQFSCAARATKNDSVLPYLLKGYSKVATYACTTEPTLYSAMDQLNIGWMKPKTAVAAADLYVKKHPENNFMDTNTGTELIESYRMRSKPRGHALLINIMHTAGRDDRPGSEKDMLKLQKLFTDLGFQITAKTDLTDHAYTADARSISCMVRVVDIVHITYEKHAQEIREEVAKLKADPGLAIVDSLVVFFMGHGKENNNFMDLIATNNEVIAAEWLVSEFQSDETTLPFLKDKPKMFFFQGCRVFEKENSPRTAFPFDMFNYGDTVMGYSTQGGNYSMRDPTTGSWFVEVFCEVIAEYAWKYHLEDMWNLIDKKMREKKCSKGGGMTELVKRGFNKRLYFNPHL